MKMSDDDRESLSDHEERLKHIEELLGDVGMTQGEHTETLALHTKRAAAQH